MKLLEIAVSNSEGHSKSLGLYVLGAAGDRMQMECGERFLVLASTEGPEWRSACAPVVEGLQLSCSDRDDAAFSAIQRRLRVSLRYTKYVVSCEVEVYMTTSASLLRSNEPRHKLT